MSITLDAATTAKLSAILSHIQGKGQPNLTAAELVSWLIDATASVRPDVADVVAKAKK